MIQTNLYYMLCIIVEIFLKIKENVTLLIYFDTVYIIHTKKRNNVTTLSI